jgi:hypothetical protein
MPTRGRVDQQLAHIAHVAAGIRRAPNDDIKDLLLLEETANRHPGQQRGRRPTTSPGLMR